MEASKRKPKTRGHDREALQRTLPRQAMRSVTRNVGMPERVLSALGGGFLVLNGFRKRRLGGAARVMIGADLLGRGLSGTSLIYRGLGIDTNRDSGPIRTERSVTVNRPPESLIPLWKSFLNGMDVTDETEVSLEWFNRKGAIEVRGEIYFLPAPRKEGTVVKVFLEYRMPAGVYGKALAGLVGRDPDRLIREDLRKFKQLAETGEIASSEMRPPAGRAGTVAGKAA